MKVLKPKQMLQRLPTALAHIKAGKPSKILLSIILLGKLFILCTEQKKFKKYMII